MKNQCNAEFTEVAEKNKNISVYSAFSALKKMIFGGKMTHYKKITTGILIGILGLIALASAQVDTAWVRIYNGPGNTSDYAYAIAVDGLRNVYVTGKSYGSTTSADYATIKYKPNGDTAWLRRYDGPGNGSDGAKAIAVDGSGNVYVTGSSVGSGTSDDYATIKYNSDTGDTLWVRRYNGPPGNSYDIACAIALDGAGNVYVTGYSRGSGTSDDYATIKYNPAGLEQWVARYNGPGNSYDWASAIAVDGVGNVYVTGYSVSTNYDYATIKYNPAGAQQWVARYDGPANGADEAFYITVDNSGNVYVLGQCTPGSPGSPGWLDYGTIKYNSAGLEQWARTYNGPENSEDYPGGLAVDGAGNVYVTGKSNYSNPDYGTIKYNSAGDTLWVRRYNGPGNSYDIANALALDGAGNVYVTGRSTGSGTSYDYATIKYNPAGLEQWVSRYNRPGADKADIANAIAVDGAGNVYVTGQSQNAGGAGTEDYATIKYVQTGAVEEERSMLDALRFTLEAIPNPFKSLIAIRYTLTANGKVSLVIYDVSGKLIKTLVNEHKTAGSYSVKWNGTNDKGKKVSEGVYFYTLNVEGQKTQDKIIKIR